MNLHFLALSLSLSKPEVQSVCDEHMHKLKGAMWFLFEKRDSGDALTSGLLSFYNVALNERARTRQASAQGAERRGVWSPCICNEWKEKRTTQQLGQIRLSETIFKIWVRVQAVTSLDHSPLLHTPLLCTPFLLHLVPLTLFVFTPSPHSFFFFSFISFTPPDFSPPSRLSVLPGMRLPEPSAGQQLCCLSVLRFTDGIFWSRSW